MVTENTAPEEQPEDTAPEEQPEDTEPEPKLPEGLPPLHPDARNTIPDMGGIFRKDGSFVYVGHNEDGSLVFDTRPIGRPKNPPPFISRMNTYVDTVKTEVEDTSTPLPDTEHTNRDLQSVTEAVRDAVFFGYITREAGDELVKHAQARNSLAGSIRSQNEALAPYTTVNEAGETVLNYDLDGDGIISPADLVAARAHTDAGYITEEGYQSLVSSSSAVQARNEALAPYTTVNDAGETVLNYDLDGDGIISPADLVAARAHTDAGYITEEGYQSLVNYAYQAGIQSGFRFGGHNFVESPSGLSVPTYAINPVADERLQLTRERFMERLEDVRYAEMRGGHVDFYDFDADGGLSASEMGRAKEDMEAGLISPEYYGMLVNSPTFAAPDTTSVHVMVGSGNLAHRAYDKAVAGGAIDISPEAGLHFNPVRLAQVLTEQEAGLLAISPEQYAALKQIGSSDAWNARTETFDPKKYIDGGGNPTTLISAFGPGTYLPGLYDAPEGAASVSASPTPQELADRQITAQRQSNRYQINYRIGLSDVAFRKLEQSLKAHQDIDWDSVDGTIRTIASYTPEEIADLKLTAQREESRQRIQTSMGLSDAAFDNLTQRIQGLDDIDWKNLSATLSERYDLTPEEIADLKTITQREENRERIQTSMGLSDAAFNALLGSLNGLEEIDWTNLSKGASAPALFEGRTDKISAPGTGWLHRNLFDPLDARAKKFVSEAGEGFISLYAEHGTTSPEAWDKVNEILKTTDNLQEAAEALGLGAVTFKQYRDDPEDWEAVLRDRYTSDGLEGSAGLSMPPGIETVEWPIPKTFAEAKRQGNFRGMDAEELESAMIFYRLVEAGLYDQTATRNQRVNFLQDWSGGREAYSAAKVEERRDAAETVGGNVITGLLPGYHTLRDWSTNSAFANTLNIMSDLAFIAPVGRAGSLAYSTFRAAGQPAWRAGLSTAKATAQGAAYGVINPFAGTREIYHMGMGSFLNPRSILGTRYRVGKLPTDFGVGGPGHTQTRLRRNVASGAPGSQPHYAAGAPDIEPINLDLKMSAFGRTVGDAPPVFRHTGPQDAPYGGFIIHSSPNIHEFGLADEIANAFAAPVAHSRFEHAAARGMLTRISDEPGVAIFHPRDVDRADPSGLYYKGKYEVETTIDAADAGLRRIGTVQLPVPVKRLYDNQTDDFIVETFDKAGKSTGYKRIDPDTRSLLETGPKSQFKGRIKTRWIRNEPVYGSRSVPMMEDLGLKKLLLRLQGEADILRPGLGREARLGKFVQTGMRLTLSPKWVASIKAQLLKQKAAGITPRVVTPDGWMLTLGPRGRVWARTKRSGPGNWGHWQPLDSYRGSFEFDVQAKDRFARPPLSKPGLGRAADDASDAPASRLGDVDGPSTRSGVRGADEAELEEEAIAEARTRALAEVGEGAARQSRAVGAGVLASLGLRTPVESERASSPDLAGGESRGGTDGREPQASGRNGITSGQPELAGVRVPPPTTLARIPPPTAPARIPPPTTLARIPPPTAPARVPPPPTPTRLGLRPGSTSSVEGASGRWPAVAVWRQGRYWKSVDFNTGRITNHRKPPLGVRSGRTPAQTYAVTRFDDDPPANTRVPLGLFDILVRRGGLDFTRNSKARSKHKDAPRYPEVGVSDRAIRERPARERSQPVITQESIEHPRLP